MFDPAALQAKLRASLDVLIAQEEERVRAREACPPSQVVQLFLRLLNEALERLERWAGDRCLARYRRMRH